MALIQRKLAAATAVAVTMSMLPAPSVAADLPNPRATVIHDADSGNAERSRRWRDRDGIDTGDVIAGVLVVGGLAAISSRSSWTGQAPTGSSAWPRRKSRSTAPPLSAIA